MTRPAFLSLALLILVLDQLSKQWVVRVYPSWPNGSGGYSLDLVPGLLALTYVHNTGGAFGILPTGTLGLAFAALVAATAIVVFVARARSPLPRLLALALALPLGGSLGNLLDRVRLRYVVDFLDVHWGSHQFPVFNVADSAICVGVALLAWHFWRQPVGDKTSPVSVTEDI